MLVIGVRVAVEGVAVADAIPATSADRTFAHATARCHAFGRWRSVMGDCWRLFSMLTAKTPCSPS
jgi:hypothetical protein